MVKIIIIVLCFGFSFCCNAQKFLVPFLQDDQMGIKNAKGQIVIPPRYERITYNGNKLMELIFFDQDSIDQKTKIGIKEIPKIQHLFNGKYFNCEIGETCSLRSLESEYSIFCHNHSRNSPYQEILNSRGDIIYTFEETTSIEYIYSDTRNVFFLINIGSESHPKYFLNLLNRKSTDILKLNEAHFYNFKYLGENNHPDFDFEAVATSDRGLESLIFNNNLKELDYSSKYSQQLKEYYNLDLHKKSQEKIYRSNKLKEVYEVKLIKILETNDSINFHFQVLNLENDLITIQPSFSDETNQYPPLATIIKSSKMGLYDRNFTEILPKDCNFKGDTNIKFSNFYITRKGSKYGIFTLKFDEENLKYEIDYLLEPVFDNIPLFYYDDYYNTKDLKIFGLYDRKTSKFVGFATDKGKMY